MSNPKITVIVPVYNVAKYVKTCIDSILAQTFQDFEILLIDDASTDESFEICKKFYGDNPKVRIFCHEENRGLGEARNTGLRNALGKYICFVDSDDLILPVTLERFYEAAEKTGAQVVQASSWYELKQGEFILRRQEYQRSGFMPPDVYWRLEQQWKMMYSWSMAWLRFCRRDFLTAHRLEFLPILSEDEPFAFALYCLAEKYFVIHEALYIYRWREDSIMNSVELSRLSKGVESMLIAAKYLEKYLDELEPLKLHYDAWRTGILWTIFIRLSPHVLPFYKHFTGLERAVVRHELKKYFGENAEFVNFFFEQYFQAEQKKASQSGCSD